MSTQYIGEQPTTRNVWPWAAALAVALAIAAFSLWKIFLNDPTPAIGSQQTTSQPNIVCNDQLALVDSVEASIQHDQRRSTTLINAGRCWLENAGTLVRVDARGQVTAGGRSGPSVELKILSGPHAGKEGWAYVPPSGL